MNTRFITCVSCLLIIFSTTISFSANRYWIGSSGGNWNNALNWSTGGVSSVPTVSDVVIFDGTSAANCTIDATVNVNAISITSAYTGIITVNSGITITVAAGGFSQAGGTFTANNGNMNVNGAFLLSGGVFNSTSATFQVTSNFTFNGGTFNPNNGTVSFSTSQTITGNTTFYNILFVASGGIYTIASGTTITSTHNVTISGGFSCTFNTGTLEIVGDLTLTSSSNNSVNGGTATFLFDGAGTQTINSAQSIINVGTNERVCALPNVEINKTSGSLNLIGLVTINGSSWKTTAGTTLVVPGTSTLNINSNVTFTGQNLSLYNIHIWANSSSVTLSPASYVLTATNNLTINGGGYYQISTGTMELLGDLTLISTSTSAVNGGTGTLLFDGTGTQNINSSATSLNYICALPNIQINKSSGALNLVGIINFNGSSWNTIAGASLINPGTAVINILKAPTISGQNLSFYDIVVTGTFNTITIASGVTWTSTHLITFAGGSSWYQINTGTLNAQGDVLVTNTNTSTSVGGNAILLFDGTANQTLTGSGTAGSGRLPQVSINKTGGVLTLASIISVDNNWTYTAGNVDAGTNSTTIDFYKTAVIDGQGASSTMSFYNVIFSGFISLGGNLDVNNDFTIRSGVNNRLDVNSTSNFQVNIAGNWINNNSVTATSFNQQNGKVVFDGGIAQVLSLASTAHSEIFYILEINNSSGGLTLNAPVSVSNNLNFITGTLFSTTTNLLLLSNNVTATGASNASFVSGPIRKTGNQAFVFPVGKNTAYAPIAIAAPAVNTDQFTAEYFQANPNTLYNITSKDGSLDHISTCENWVLDRTTGTSNVAVTVSWNTRSCGVNNLTDLRVARWNGTQWKDQGNGGTTGTNTSGTLLSSGVVTSFSPFTLASAGSTNPLPIELLSFSGACYNDSILLNWTTASEINNHYFTIEHSMNGINWTIVDTLIAKNKTSITHYNLIDAKNNHQGFNYYRLKQTDFNGQFHYFNTIEVNDCNAKAEVFIFPNPSTAIFYFSGTENIGIIESVDVFNAVGERIDADYCISSICLINQPAGVYFIHFKLANKIIVKQIILNK